jgi:5-methylcytosine-specific restriction enzyme subunit McrC
VNVRHEVFIPDRPENRLLRSALERVRQATRDPANWRLAHELSVLLEQIPKSVSQATDFRAWRKDRLMAHYAPVKPWCELVLGETMPVAQRGSHLGISLLFPMEKLFEQYVASVLQRQLPSGIQMKRQASSRSLCEHGDGWIFQLNPDIVLEGRDQAWVLDTKWKMLNVGAKNYDIHPGDVYQMLAYGYRYLGQRGDVYLVYPATSQLTAPLSKFAFSQDLCLKVVPFDLVTDRLLGELPAFMLPVEDLAEVGL